MKALPTTCPLNVAGIDNPDQAAGNARHLYAIQFGGPDQTLRIQFQHGPRGGEGSKAGIFEDALLAILEDRLRGFQSGEFACEENAVALQAVKEARLALDMRVAKRMAQNVLGVNEKHNS